MVLFRNVSDDLVQVLHGITCDLTAQSINENLLSGGEM